MDAIQVGHAAARTGWSARMLRYLEQAGLVVRRAAPQATRQYGLRELNQLRSSPRTSVSPPGCSAGADFRAAVDGWLAGMDDTSWVEWEQRKHERLLTAA